MNENSPIFFPLEILASSSPLLSSSNWQNHLLLDHPMSPFPLNFNSNTFLSIKTAYDDTVASVV
jgi:hypothetical protein